MQPNKDILAWRVVWFNSFHNNVFREGDNCFLTLKKTVTILKHTIVPCNRYICRRVKLMKLLKELSRLRILHLNSQLKFNLHLRLRLNRVQILWNEVKTVVILRTPCPDPEENFELFVRSICQYRNIVSAVYHTIYKVSVKVGYWLCIRLDKAQILIPLKHPNRSPIIFRHRVEVIKIKSLHIF